MGCIARDVVPEPGCSAGDFRGRYIDGWTAAQKAVLGAVTVQDIGKASGVFNMFRILGGATGIAIAVVAFSIWGNLGSEKDFSEGFAHVMGVCAVLSMAAVLSATWQPTHRAATAAQSANL